MAVGQSERWSEQYQTAAEAAAAGDPTAREALGQPVPWTFCADCEERHAPGLRCWARAQREAAERIVGANQVDLTPRGQSV